MNKPSDKEILLNLLRERYFSRPLDEAWFYKYEVVGISNQITPWGFLGSEAKRRIQELAQAEAIEKDEHHIRKDGKKFCAYRYIPSHDEQFMHKSRFKPKLRVEINEASQTLL